MTAAKTLDYGVRIAGVIALALGLALWSGRLYGLVNLHMVLGVVVVLGLWALAALALRRGVARGVAALALPWGLATLALGPSQTGLLVSELHWVVQVAHLLLGLGAIALAAVLAGSLQQAPRRAPAT
jgi:thiamine transporter ThiT